jgi:hypothetical protein
MTDSPVAIAARGPPAVDARAAHFGLARGLAKGAFGGARIGVLEGAPAAPAGAVVLGRQA